MLKRIPELLKLLKCTSQVDRSCPDRQAIEMLLFAVELGSVRIEKRQHNATGSKREVVDVGCHACTAKAATARREQSRRRERELITAARRTSLAGRGWLCQHTLVSESFRPAYGHLLVRLLLAWVATLGTFSVVARQTAADSVWPFVLTSAAFAAVVTARGNRAAARATVVVLLVAAAVAAIVPIAG